MTILITGGAGFIGSHIAKKLIALGHRVIVFDDFSTGKKENLKGLKIKLIEGDIRDLNTLKKAMHGVDFVCHHAAQISVPKSISNPQETIEINGLGTLNVLLAAKENNVKKITFASSSAVYGDTKNLPIKEKEPIKPLSPYAVSKLLGEYYLKAFSHLYGMKIAIFRYFNVFGDGQDPNSPYSAAIPKFIKMVNTGDPITVFGDGMQTRDFVSVEDVVDANIKALNTETGEAPMNIGCGHAITINELANAIGGKTIHLPERKGDIKHSLADISRAKKILGFKPKKSVTTWIREFL